MGMNIGLIFTSRRPSRNYDNYIGVLRFLHVRHPTVGLPWLHARQLLATSSYNHPKTNSEVTFHAAPRKHGMNLPLRIFLRTGKQYKN